MFEFSDLKKEKIYCLPVFCENCGRQGFIIEEQRSTEAYIVCEKCGWATSQVWCTKCHKTGKFVQEIEKKPVTWICPKCGREEPLFPGFYESPVYINYEEDLPKRRIYLVPRFPVKRNEVLTTNIILAIGIPLIMLLDYLRITHKSLEDIFHVPHLTLWFFIILILFVIGIFYFFRNKFPKKSANTDSNKVCFRG